MAQSGYTPLSLYYSATATSTPTAGNLVAGELALNTADGKLFYKDSSGVVQVIASKAGNVNVASFSGGTTGLTPNTATTGAVTLAGTLAQANGGTGFSTYTTGDTLYASASNTLSKLPIGTTGQILSVVAGVPAWTTATSGTLTVGTTTVASGTSGYVLYNNAGTLGNLANTGTGNNVLATSPTIVTPTIDKINTSVANTSLGAGDASIMKNRIINGAMVIDQRNAGASTTPSGTATNIYLLDRWAYLASQASKFTFQQNAGSVTPPVGFSNYLGATVNATATVGAGDYFWLSHSIEGYNIGDLGFGTANAKTVTVSFWVRSSLTGTFAGGLTNANGGTTASSRCYPFTYTISAANTWEQKTITIAGDTSGTWNGSTNAIGMALILGLGVGSAYTTTAGSWAGSYYCATGGTNIVSNSGATFYITGVQLEVGSSATGFEYRQYGQEFDLCRRYFEIYSGGTNTEGNIPQGIAQVDAANRPEIMLFYYPKRTGPTITTSGTMGVNTMANTGYTATYLGTYVGTYNYGSNLFFSVSTGVTPNTLSGIVMLFFGSGGGSVSISAEL